MISMYYQNINGMRTKLQHFYQNVLNSDYDVICLTETNLNSGIFDGEVIDSRYNVYRRDRDITSSSKESGGGVLIAVKKKFHVLRQANWDSDQEDIWITILPNNCHAPKINLCVCYLPPDLNCSKRDEFYSNCQNIMLNRCEDDRYLIVGDFNTPEYSPITLDIDEHIPQCKRLLLLQEFITIGNLQQSNNIPNEKGRYLDLVLSSISALTVVEANILCLKDKHHPALEVEFPIACDIPKNLKQNNKRRLNFAKCNCDSIRRELQLVDWHNLLSSSDVNDCVNIFYDKLFEIIKKFAPLTTVKSDKYPVWYSKPLIKCIDEKTKYHKLFKKFNNPRDYDVFSLLRTRSKKMIDQCYKNYVASIEETLPGNLKSFWKFVNNRKGYASIPNVMQFNNSTSSTGQGVCELFSNYFASMFESDNTRNNSSAPSNDTRSAEESVNSMSQIHITCEDILSKIKLIDVNKGAGPDQIPPSFVKRCGKELCTPLCIIFNKSLTNGVFPDRWKIAHIIPIFKSGDKSRCENYRPISILSYFAKLFESLVNTHLYNHFKPLISENQHGFVKGRSTVTNLLVYKNYLCKSFAAGGQVDSIYTDFTKAFDKVNHRLLRNTLVSYGIHGNLLRWLTSYLNNRSQLVALRGYLSSPIDVTSGVPQGSHLGPVLFVVFINDLIKNISSDCLLYADDLKIFRTIKSSEDCDILQKDLNAVSHWCKANLMYLNIEKCFVITFTNKYQQIVNDYSIDEQVLKRKYVAKDLGITFDSKLSFREHYQEIVTKANQLLGFILRSTKDFKDVHSTLYLYNTLIRTTLEYGSVIWSPHYSVHVENIERVQRKCLRILCYRQHLGRATPNYEARLVNFNLQRLDIRRQYFDFIHIYKIIHSVFDVPNLLTEITFNTRYSARRGNTTGLFVLKVYRNNISFYNPLVRMARQCNELARENPDFDIFTPKLSLFIKFVKDVLYHRPSL